MTLVIERQVIPVWKDYGGQEKGIAALSGLRQIQEASVPDATPSLLSGMPIEILPSRLAFLR